MRISLALRYNPLGPQPIRVAETSLVSPTNCPTRPDDLASVTCVVGALANCGLFGPRRYNAWTSSSMTCYPDSRSNSTFEQALAVAVRSARPSRSTEPRSEDARTHVGPRFAEIGNGADPKAAQWKSNEAQEQHPERFGGEWVFTGLEHVRHCAIRESNGWRIAACLLDVDCQPAMWTIEAASNAIPRMHRTSEA